MAKLRNEKYKILAIKVIVVTSRILRLLTTTDDHSRYFGCSLFLKHKNNNYARNISRPCKVLVEWLHKNNSFICSHELRKTERPNKIIYTAGNLITIMLQYLVLFFSCILFILLSRESDQSAIKRALRSCRSLVYHTKMGESRKVPFATAQQVSLPACSAHCPFNAERQTGKL